jgi:hypothetical protein
MAVPVPSISCCVLNHHNVFYQIQNAIAFNQDACCHLALCLQLLPLESWLIFSLLVAKLLAISCFPITKSCETCMGPILPGGCRDEEKKSLSTLTLGRRIFL